MLLCCVHLFWRFGRNYKKIEYSIFSIYIMFWVATIMFYPNILALLKKEKHFLQTCLKLMNIIEPLIVNVWFIFTKWLTQILFHFKKFQDSCNYFVYILYNKFIDYILKYHIDIPDTHTHRFVLMTYVHIMQFFFIMRPFHLIFQMTTP